MIAGRICAGRGHRCTLRQISLSCAWTSFTRPMFLLLTKFSRHHSCSRDHVTAQQLDFIDVPSLVHRTHLVTADFLERSVNVQQCHVVSFTGHELLAHREHLVPPGRRVVQHGVHGQQRHDAQNLLRAREVRGQQDGLVWSKQKSACELTL